MNKYVFLVFSVIFFSPFSVFGNVVINEVMYNPVGPDANHEWVEIINSGSEGIDISNLKFQSLGLPHLLTLISGDSVLDPSEMAIITNDTDQFIADNPEYTGTLFNSFFSLSNLSDNISIVKDDGAFDSSLKYSRDWGANGDGKSLQYRKNLEEWFAGVPTPGKIYQDTESKFSFKKISQNTIWTVGNSPYVISGELNVATGATLTIENGVKVVFDQIGFINVVDEGVLRVLGTKDSHVVFTSNQLSPQVGDYDNGIILNSGLASIVKYTDFSYAGNAISVSGGSVTVENSIFANNNLGIDILNGSVVNINKNIFSQNQTGVYYHDPSLLGIKQSALKSLFTWLVKTVYADVVGNPNIVISQNSFKNNYWVGIENDSSWSPLLDVRNNYWNSPGGPKHLSNPTGTGDAVSNKIAFNPWLTAEPSDEVVEPSCTENCNSNVMFLPGLEGSRLYKPDYNGGTETLWEPNFESSLQYLFMDGSGNSPRSDIYTKKNGGVIDEAYSLAPLGNVYKSFLSDLNDWKNPTKDNLIADYSAVPYDWRLTFADLLSYGSDMDGRIYYTGDLAPTTTPYIIQELNRLAKNSRNGKVTIIAHSNGGLLAKALLKRLEDTNNPLFSKIDKLILVAVPQTGTPQAVGALLHGYDLGLPSFVPDWLPEAFKFVLKPSLAREFAKNTPGIYPLLPSESYWNSVGETVTTPIVTFVSGGFTPIQDAIAKYGASISSKTALFDFINGSDGRVEPTVTDTESPAKANSSLTNYSDSIHNSLDSWVPPSTIQVDQIAGWGEPTLAGLEYRAKVDGCLEYVSSGACVKFRTAWTYTPNLVVNGDGTVVEPSALAMSTSSPNIERWWVNLDKYKDGHVNRKHGDILEVSNLRDLIRNKIVGENYVQNNIISSSTPTSQNINKLIFVLHSPLDLTLRDTDGNYLSSSTQDISGGSYLRFGDVQVAVVPKDSNPKVILNGYSSGYFDLDIKEISNDLVTATTTFASIPTSTTTTATIDLPNGTIVSALNLQVDTDGNGSIDLSLKPKVGQIVTIPPTDSIAPESKITFSTSTDSVLVTGFDDMTLNPTVSTNATSSTIADEAGNTLKLVYINKKTANSTSFVLSKLEYSTTTKTTVTVSATSNYLWLKTTKSAGYLVFASFLKTPLESVVSVYDPIRKKTVIYSLPKTLSTVDLNTVVQTLPKGVIIKTTLNGMVTPYLNTSNGQILIKY